ncbi:MAG: hypothetical protein EXR35_10675 [Limnohabitans sp.]|nr:hypothetical protein [Limnohabitans sp.]
MLLVSALLACSEDKVESKFKPIPLRNAQTKNPTAESTDKKEDVATDKNDESQALKSLKARPPTSGKEPMLILGKDKRPLTELVHTNPKLDYYECKGIVADWFLELLVSETNYFSELVELPFVNVNACIVSVGSTKSLMPGRISVNLFTTTQELKNCIKGNICPVFRSINLVEKGQALRRSYFISDMSRKLVNQNCVTEKGKLHKDISCYEVE